MTTQRSAAKTRRARTPQTRSRDLAYGIPVPEALHEAIENERSNLSRAESVLGCLAMAMEIETDIADRPYYPDVAQLARELVRQSINGLDSLVLQRHLLRDKIKECPDLADMQGAYAAAARNISFERSFGVHEELRLSLPIVVRTLDQRRATAPE
jgi:hypothetical protein